MKKIFIYNIEIFDSQILVAVGVTAKQVDKWLKKNGLKSIKNVMNKEITNRFIEASKNDGFVQFITNGDITFYILWLKDFKWEMTLLDILNHEIVHLRQFMFADKNIENELEFEAYFQESVFRELRKKLNKFCK